ncbi:MAG TPA: sensor histidine kinase [Cyclobacteriaceae bacterium]|nr:sensor histidine kinase [Cyclobacteriaceae bacterium]
MPEYGELRPYLGIYTGDSDNLDIRSVMSDRDIIFQPYQEEKLSKIKSYWIRFQVRNETPERLPLCLYLGGVDYFYFYSPQDSLIPIKGGGLMPEREKTYKAGGVNWTPVSLNPGDTKTFYIGIKNGFFGNSNMTCWLMSEDRFREVSDRENVNFWQGIFHGVLWVMIVYNIFFAVIGRDKTYLYYALYMISISIYFLNILGILKEFLFPNQPHLIAYVTLVMQVAIILYMLFVRNFLNLRKILPVWNRIVDYLIIASVILLVIKTSYYIIYQRFGIFRYISQVETILGAMLTIALILALYRSKSILARYFLLGSIALGTGLAVSAMMSFTSQVFSPAYFSSFQIGIVFEILFFSIGLSYKMSETEKEKNITHQELIRQLKENESLQQNYTRELEREVSDRTHEILEQKKELENQTAKLESLNEEKNHLIGIVAHDLRNPLTSALSMITYLNAEPGNLSNEQAESARILESSLERMNSMVDKILDIKAIESKKLNLELHRTSLSEIAKEVLGEFAEMARNKSITINSRLEDVPIIADRNYMSQVIENLVSNAIKFSPAHKAINVRVYKSGVNARLEVEDEGPGFTDNDKLKLFRKYQRLSAKPTAGESSTGLGLSIVKKFVDLHNGRVFVESTDGRGAKFVLEFESVG